MKGFLLGNFLGKYDYTEGWIKELKYDGFNLYSISNFTCWIWKCAFIDDTEANVIGGKAWHERDSFYSDKEDAVEKLVSLK